MAALNKPQVRTQKKLQRQRLSSAEVNKYSQAIFKKVTEQIDWNQVKRLHVYKTIPSLNEVNTQPIIDFIKKQFPDIKVLYPDSKPTNLEVIIIPLLAFDSDGNRIGQGGGYYDRFLRKYPYAKKIGLAYEFQKVDNIPVEPHDVKLDTIITEKTVHKF